MTAKLSSNAQAISRSRLPKELRFLKNGYTSTLGHDDLTAIGRQELFDHGVKYVSSQLSPFSLTIYYND